MKNLIYRMSLFCLPIVICVVGSEIYLRTMPSAYKQKRDQLVENADSIEILILGNSHTADGVDPNQFDLYTHNLAFGSQGFYFDRKLIEKYLPILPHLKYVILNFDYHCLSFEHEGNRDFFYKYYYDIDYKDRKFYKEYLLQSFFVYTPEQTLSLMLNSLTSKQEDKLVKGWAGFPDSDYKTVTSVEKNKLKARGTTEMIKNYAGGDAVLNDLESIITTLQSKNVTPILVNCPNYSTLRDFFDPDIIDKNQAVADYLVQKYGIVYLDYFDDDSFTVADYHNCDHLDEQGARKLSQKINAVIRQIESTNE